MLRPNTVFIIGAAANAEYRNRAKKMAFPLGNDLKSRIQDLIPDEWHGARQGRFVRAVNVYHGDQGSIAAQALKRALRYALSIDNLVEHRSDDETFVQVAKLAIAEVINDAERQNSEFDAKDSAGTVFGEIFRLIMSGVNRNDIEAALGRVQFVTFNYDRTLEAFFLQALQHYCGMSPDRAEGAVRRMTIHHVYGSLGELSRQRDAVTRYGADGDIDELRIISSTLRTFSEKTLSEEAGRLKRIVQDAKRLVFLGCAHHRRNFDLLQPRATTFTALYGTHYAPAPEDRFSAPTLREFAEPGIQAMKRDLRTWSHFQIDRIEMQDMNIEPMTCLQLIAKYGSQWVDT